MTRGSRFIAAAGLAVTLCAASSVDGQYTTNRSILTLLPVEGTLGIGQAMDGQLTDDDFEFSGQVVRAFSIEGQQGEPITIDVISTEFDAYAYLIGPDGLQVESDDDSGGECNARISTFFPESGRYLVVAGSLSGSTGPFMIRADVRQHPQEPGACGDDGAGYDAYEDEMVEALSAMEPAGTITLGDSIAEELTAQDAQLDDGSYARAYELTGTPGQTVFVDLGSRAFDTMIMVLDPRGEGFSSDDDSGGACNSRIELTLDMQPHKLVVTSFSGEETGLFTLSVSGEAGPMSTLDCPGLN